MSTGKTGHMDGAAPLSRTLRQGLAEEQAPQAMHPRREAPLTPRMPADKGMPESSMRIAITSGYFDPLHRGHLDLLRLAARQGDQLWVIVNNDRQASLKKGSPFLDEATRLEIVSSLRMVDRAVLSIDGDGSVCATLGRLLAEAAENGDAAIFCKGGDRNAGNIPELAVLERHGARLVDGLGAKIDSSSSILARLPAPPSGHRPS